MPKQAKIALIVAGLLLGLGGVAWHLFSGEGSPLATRVAVVDVTTGQAMTLPTDDPRLRVMPGVNDAGERALYPIVKEGAGWIINPRYQDLLVERFGKDDRLKIDLDSFASPSAP